MAARPLHQLKHVAVGCSIAALSTLSGGCGPKDESARAQWLVSVRTDVPLVRWGDRLLIEVLDEDGNGCDDCFRLAAASDAGRWPISFGIKAVDDRTWLLRARLFRAADQAGNVPQGPEGVVDLLTRLPRAEGLTRVELLLSMKCYGVGVVLPFQSCDPTNGVLSTVSEALPPGAYPPDADAPWLAQYEEPCTEAPPGMACIAGGVFRLGTPEAVSLALPPADLRPNPERLTHVSPFAIDVEEFTVGDLRSLIAKGLVAAPPSNEDAFCAFLGTDSADNDEFPLNCVDHSFAEAACEVLGKRLPTEAEWEYAAGNLDKETVYPWGMDNDICGHAVVERGAISASDPLAFTTCRYLPAEHLPPGPVEHGSARDSTDLGVHNLGGNVAEWVLDASQAYSGPCWGGPIPLNNPVCGGTATFSVRGASWSSSRDVVGVTVRDRFRGTATSASIGFRCALGRP